MNDPSEPPADATRNRALAGRPNGRLAAAALLIGAALLGGACRAAAPPAPARFVFSMQTEPTTLNFVTATDAASVLVERLLSDFLVDHDRRLEIVPRLAESWDWSADHRTLTFHLRTGVRFHDGRPLTSDDVLFTYERLVDPKSKAVGRLDGFLPVESVTAPDARTVVVRYREPYAPALRTWEIPILPAHRYRGVDFETAPENRAPVGAGPFRFAAWDSGSRIVLRRNDDYWGGRPAIDEFVFRFQPSLDTSLLALLAGETDYTKITATAWGTRRQDPAFASRYKVLTFTPLFFYYIAWRGDGSNPWFADPLVRRALGAALDREGYIRSVLKGLGSPVSGPLSLLLPAVTPTPGTSGPAAHSAADSVADAVAPAGAPVSLFDPDRAARLLDEAGWRLDRRTGLRARGGRPFRFTLLVFAGGEDHVQFAQVAQDTLRRIGVEMRVERLDWPALWSRLKSGQFEAALSGFSPTPDPDSLYGMLHSSQIGGGQNYAAYRDPEVDRWLEEGRRELDPARRDAIYRRIAARLDEAQPYTTLFSPSVVGALNGRFEGAEASPQGILGHVPGALALRPATGGR
ncbi:MAG TPA: ABC transporter substrate-binding protein [Candidatus Polarisedimenticolia bacterium]|nr:ABC transporter substrate-binding protein [Candidatus Polarisedimenticolia bacterium]